VGQAIVFGGLLGRACSPRIFMKKLPRSSTVRRRRTTIVCATPASTLS